MSASKFLSFVLFSALTSASSLSYAQGKCSIIQEDHRTYRVMIDNQEQAQFKSVYASMSFSDSFMNSLVDQINKTNEIVKDQAEALAKQEVRLLVLEGKCVAE